MKSVAPLTPMVRGRAYIKTMDGIIMDTTNMGKAEKWVNKGIPTSIRWLFRLCSLKEQRMPLSYKMV